LRPIALTRTRDVLPAPPLGGAPRLRPFARTRPHEAVKCEWTSETLGIGLLVGRPLAGSAISFGVLPLVEPAREQERTRRAAYTSFGPESYERFTSGSCPPSPESPVVPPGLRGGAFAPPAHPGASIRFPVRRAFARPFSPASRVRVGGRTRNRSARRSATGPTHGLRHDRRSRIGPIHYDSRVGRLRRRATGVPDK